MKITLSKSEAIDLMIGESDMNQASLYLHNGYGELLWDMQVSNFEAYEKICAVRDLSTSEYTDEFEIDDEENYDEIYQNMLDDYKYDLEANLVSYVEKTNWITQESEYIDIEWID